MALSRTSADPRLHAAAANIVNHLVEHGSHRARCAVVLPMTTIVRACASGSASIAYCSNALPAVPRLMSSARCAATGGLSQQPMLKRNSHAQMAVSDGWPAEFVRWEEARPVTDIAVSVYMATRGFNGTHPVLRYHDHVPLGRGVDVRFVPRSSRSHRSRHRRYSARTLLP